MGTNQHQGEGSEPTGIVFAQDVEAYEDWLTARADASNMTARLIPLGAVEEYKAGVKLFWSTVRRLASAGNLELNIDAIMKVSTAMLKAATKVGDADTIESITALAGDLLDRIQSPYWSVVGLAIRRLVPQEGGGTKEVPGHDQVILNDSGAGLVGALYAVIEGRPSVLVASREGPGMFRGATRSDGSTSHVYVSLAFQASYANIALAGPSPLSDLFLDWDANPQASESGQPKLLNVRPKAGEQDIICDPEKFVDKKVQVHHHRVGDSGVVPDISRVDVLIPRDKWPGYIWLPLDVFDAMLRMGGKPLMSELALSAITLTRPHCMA